VVLLFPAALARIPSSRNELASLPAPPLSALPVFLRFFKKTINKPSSKSIKQTYEHEYRHTACFAAKSLYDT
jgi:hypothetical protein